MQRYINQLLEDIIKAERETQNTLAENLVDHADSLDIDSLESDAMDGDFEDLERWMESDPAQTFSHFCGLQKEQLPPAERLTEIQMQQIINAFYHLLHTWNLGASIPEKFPINRHYTLLTSMLDEKTTIVNSGFITFDFCSGNPEGCRFEEYCECLKYWKEEGV